MTTDNFEIRAIPMQEAYPAAVGLGQRHCGPRDTEMIRVDYQFPSGLCDRLSLGASDRRYVRSGPSASSQKSLCYLHN